MLLPLRVIGSLLGVPSGEAENFRMHIEPLLTRTGAVELAATEYALADLLDGLIAQKRAQPAEDLLSALVQMRLSHDELVSTALLLILAGYDTAVHLINNGVLTLLRNPSQLAKLRADSSLLPAAVEEYLRFESPLNVATARFTTETVRIGEVEIPAGQLVLVRTLWTNHDTCLQANPDHSDPHPTPQTHVGFGSGIHHCLAARLVGLEGEIAIRHLLCRFRRITLADNNLLQYRSNAVTPRLTALPVRLGADC
jgi:cytochrome P450